MVKPDTVLALLAAALLAIGCEGTALGAMKLDNYTFDKVLAIPEHTIFTKFDQSYAYGEKEDEFKTLCKLAYTVPNFFIAEVPVQEYGDKENDDLRERYKLKKDDFPVYFLFAKGDSEGKKYDGSIKAADMALWLRKQGIKFPSVGTIAELDELATKFFKDGKSADVVTKAQGLADSEYKTDKKAPMYAKIMQKIIEKGDEYISTESARVTKMMEGKLAAEKKAEFSDKLRILGVFASKKDEL
eukprot:gnl/TRDRNA2_/TRDRNA2_84044_c0_seq1.p1 gnl/TRDRNA2_/TRDRNA2_84044_c0~~gnl/TRDRNA2_/TRDRNA2_84044_c0_seq1.p1  ORF type:complete len:243 (-),score=92.59 gnl/TRDRNA2_/TRDRNA2_84044_c0_seq1:66-794(-)